MAPDAPDYTAYSDIANVYGDVKIYTPSGLYVVGSDIITSRFVTGTLLVDGDSEETIFDSAILGATSRGRIRQVGLMLRTSTAADTVSDAVLRVYLDDDYGGDPTFYLYVWDIDLLNGGHIIRRSAYGLYDSTTTIDSTTYEVYYARTISARGGLNFALRDSTEPTLTGFRASTCWVSLDCEWLEKCLITFYNENSNPANSIYCQAIVLYGLYP